MSLDLSRDTMADGITLRFRGNLGVEQARDIYGTLRALATDESARRVEVDLAGVGELDSISAAALCEGRDLLERSGKQVMLTPATERQRSALDLVTVREQTEGGSDETTATRSWLPPLLDLAELMVDTWTAWLKIPLGRERVRLGATAEQAVRLGVDAFPVVALLSFLTGLILAFQAAFQLRRFGAEPLVAEIVGLGMVREFGALMTAIILSGRSGAAIAAELGTMTIRDEVDALRTIGVSPVSFLVVPRVVALGVLQPILTMWATGIGLAGGLLTTRLIGLPMPAIYARMRESLGLHDFTLAFGKSVLFAGIIAFTGCYLGLRTHGGARSVGESTTRCVVLCILLIVVVDSIITTLWTNAGLGRS